MKKCNSCTQSWKSWKTLRDNHHFVKELDVLIVGLVSVAESMQEQLTAQKTGKRNKENSWRAVDVLAVATTLIKYADVWVIRLKLYFNKNIAFSEYYIYIGWKVQGWKGSTMDGSKMNYGLLGEFTSGPRSQHIVSSYISFQRKYTWS